MQKDTVNRIATLTQSMPLSDGTISTLRDEFPDIHFTYCSDDDIQDTIPAHEYGEFNLYFVDGNDHCLKFTSNIERATGIVIAEVYDDE